MRGVFLTLAAIALCSTSAFATDLFTLNVPVQVSHLNPAISQVKITCVVSSQDPFSPQFGVPPISAAKSKNVLLMNGAFNGTTTIVFTTDDFKSQDLSNLTYIHSGSCTLALLGRGGALTPTMSANDPVTAAQPGTPLVTSVYFSIP